MRNNQLIRLSGAALMALFVGACGPSFSAQTPSGFVQLPDTNDYDYRATTAEGVVVAVREIENDAHGETEFWVTAITNKMREKGGYALLETVQVTSADGLAGTQLRFGHDDGNNTPHLYYLTLFVTPDTLWLLEAGGTKERITAQVAKIDQAVSSFRTR